MPPSKVVKPTEERRPRIDADLAARIDTLRGDVPFEKYVRKALREIVGGVTIEPDPDASPTDSVGRRKPGFRILDANGDVLVSGLLEHEAIRRSYNIAISARAYNIAHELVAVGQTEMEEEDLDAMIEIAESIYVLSNRLLGVDSAKPLDEDDDRDPATSPVTDEPWRINPYGGLRPPLVLSKEDADLAGVTDREAPPRS